MRLVVFVHDVPVATLESTDNFEHVLAYHPQVSAKSFISLIMPVRTKSYNYPELHPVFRMNLPEGYLLSVLQEQFGPHVGASPLNLLSVVGRNAIGRIKVAPPGADPQTEPLPFELQDILRGDNSEAAFEHLVRRFAASGVSGVVPKFLSPGTAAPMTGHKKATLPTEKFIIKGTTSRHPGVALNEHFCMQVAQRAFGNAARTEISEDGQALVVHRFDYAEDGVTRLGMEDLCSLLALRPEQKYDSTWEKVANRIIQVTPAVNQSKALSDLANLLLLTYALRNADCHTKNIAVLYSDDADVRLAPVYDMLTITVYDDYCRNPPGMSVGGRSTWKPGKALDVYLRTRCGLKPSEVGQRVERLCEAIVEVSPDVARASRGYKAFETTGPRMLHAWNEGMNSLRLSKTWSIPSLEPLLQGEGIAQVDPPQAPSPTKIGKSTLSMMS